MWAHQYQNKKAFIQSLGADCANWLWSWSYVNHAERFVLFGAWDDMITPRGQLILRDAWQAGKSGRTAGYGQSRRHVDLVLNDGYDLFTFRMRRGLRDPSDPGGPSKILDFEERIVRKNLVRAGDDWIAEDLDP